MKLPTMLKRLESELNNLEMLHLQLEKFNFRGVSLAIADLKTSIASVKFQIKQEKQNVT